VAIHEDQCLSHVPPEIFTLPTSFLRTCPSVKPFSRLKNKDLATSRLASQTQLPQSDSLGAAAYGLGAAAANRLGLEPEEFSNENP
jgi:hypothetical protein